MATTTNEATLSYFTLIGKCEEADDTSYDRRPTTARGDASASSNSPWSIPGMQDRVRVEFARGGRPLHRPAEPVGAGGELAGGQRLGDARHHLRAPQRAGGREGGRAASSSTSAPTLARRPTDERKQLQAARKAQKTQAKQRRAARAAEKAAKKAAEQAAKATHSRRRSAARIA